MKLKKIASLALAGAMAVSMLAGCANKDNSSSSGATTPTTTSVVDAVNNGQDASNKVKITFTDDAKLDSALAKAIELNVDAVVSDPDADATVSAIKTAITNLTGIKEDAVPNGWDSQFKAADGLMKVGTQYDDTTVGVIKTHVEEDDTFTAVKVGFVSALNADAAAKMVAAQINTTVSTLDSSTYDAQKKFGLKDGGNYFDYSYDGDVSLTSYTNAAGTTVYFYAAVLNQTVTVQEL